MNETEFGIDGPDGSCDACVLKSTRREFVRDGLVVAALGALASLGVTRTAGALVLGRVRGLRVAAATVSYPLPAEDGAQIDKDAQVILVRWPGFVYDFALSCPHQNTALHWLPEDGRFQCPKHKSKYTPDGTFISGRATRGMDRFSLHLDGTTVMVDVAAMHKQDKDPAGWAAALLKIG